MAKNNRTEARIHRHRRVRKYISGTAVRPRLSVFRSLAEIYAQVIDDGTGVTLASASSIDHELREKLKGLKRSNKPALLVNSLRNVPRIRESPRWSLTVVVSNSAVV